MSVQPYPAGDPDEQLVNHVPDELCVDVSAPHGSDPAALYEQARVALNRPLQGEATPLTQVRLRRDGLTAPPPPGGEPHGLRDRPRARSGFRVPPRCRW